jgi:hypothetical protein
MELFQALAQLVEHGRAAVQKRTAVDRWLDAGWGAIE